MNKKIVLDDFISFPESLDKKILEKILGEGISFTEIIYGLSPSERKFLRFISKEAYERFLNESFEEIAYRKDFFSFLFLEKIEDLKSFKGKIPLKDLYLALCKAGDVKDFALKKGEWILLPSEWGNLTMEEIDLLTESYIRIYLESFDKKNSRGIKSDIEFLNSLRNSIKKERSKTTRVLDLRKRQVISNVRVLYELYKRERVDFVSPIISRTHVEANELASLIPFLPEEYVERVVAEVKDSDNEFLSYLLIKFFPNVRIGKVTFHSFSCPHPFFDEEISSREDVELISDDGVGVFSGKGKLAASIYGYSREEALSLRLCLFHREEVLREGKVPDFFDWEHCSHYFAEFLGELLGIAEYRRKFNWKYALSVGIFHPEFLGEGFDFEKIVLEKRFLHMEGEEIEKYYLPELRKRFWEVAPELMLLLESG